MHHLKVEPLPPEAEACPKIWVVGPVGSLLNFYGYREELVRLFEFAL